LVLIDGGVQAARLQKKCRSLAYENDTSAFFELFSGRAVCVPIIWQTSRLHSKY
jgi:hypothetical protein